MSNRLVDLYQSGMSLRDVSREVGLNYSQVRSELKLAGVVRSRDDGVALAADQGKQARGRLGKKFPHSAAAKAKMSATHKARWEGLAVGTRINSRGYLEYTRGQFKGRTVHSVVLEQKLGRRLLPDECGHHIDHNKLNNDPGNLTVMTRSAHTSHHRKEAKHGIS